MEGLEVGGCIEESSKHKDIKLFGVNPEEGAVFDASQYAFFRNDVVEEVELGGLEDEEEGLPSVDFDDEDYQLDLEEIEAIGSLSEVDDLTNTFSKLNKVVSSPRGGMIIDRGSRANEYSC